MTFLLIKTVLNIFLIPVSLISIILSIYYRILISKFIFNILNLCVFILKSCIFGLPIISFFLICINWKWFKYYISTIPIIFLLILPLSESLLNISTISILLLNYYSTFDNYKYYITCILINLCLSLLYFKILKIYYSY